MTLRKYTLSKNGFTKKASPNEKKSNRSIKKNVFFHFLLSLTGEYVSLHGSLILTAIEGVRFQIYELES